MTDTIETITLGTPLENVDLNLHSQPTNGSLSGVELLANQTKINKSDDYETLDDLESSLNNLVQNQNVTQPVVNVEPEHTKTWDGFAKYDNIPNAVDMQPTKEDVLREKFRYLRLLEDLEKKGVNVSQKYTMESSLLDMKGEYETIKNEKEKQNSVKFQGKILMALLTGVEFMNSKFDPFDIKIDGWSEQVSENLSDYDEIFGELFEKYKSKGKIAPEIKLLFQLAGSAVMIHMTNTMLKSSMPGMDDIMRENPDLMQQFTKAAVDSMSQKHPSFGEFMNTSDAMPRNRPDLNSTYKRTEMKGPSDINELLSGLKTHDNVETVSVDDMKDISNDNVPRKSRRKSGSEKNTISLNL